MLVAISYTTAVNSNTAHIEKKESPLYKIKTRWAIGEKISEIVKNIKIKYLGQRIFFIPFRWIFGTDGYYIESPYAGAKCNGGYTDAGGKAPCTGSTGPSMTCVETHGSCCPTGSK